MRSGRIVVAALAAAIAVAGWGCRGVDVEIVNDLAPRGPLRAAINIGNPILATRDADGTLRGVSVDIARELARRLRVGLALVTYEAAGRVVQNAGADAWDIGFVAVDPERASDITFTAPYVIIEGAYLVPNGSPIQTNDDVDREGVRVIVGEGSAYDLFLSRTLQHASILRAPTSPAVVETMVAEKADVAAGVRQQLEVDAQRLGGLRVLDGRFMVIEQAMAVPRGRDAAAQYLRTFVEELKASGFIAAALERHGVTGVSVAPPVAAAAAE